MAGKDPKDFGVDPVSFGEMLPGCYDVTARLADMDTDGVHAQMCFPSFPGFAGGTFFAAEDKELATACVVAWNDFILDEWCAAAPDRFIPMVMVPFWDVAASVAEVRAHRGQGGQGDHLHRGAAPARPALVPRRPLGPASSPPPRRPTCPCACTSAAAAPPWPRPTPTSPSPSRSSG